MATTETKPRYIQLSDDLRARIKNGEWEIGDRLPSFTEMYDEHGAATATIQKVYDVLEKEGFVERRARSGVYVTSPPPVQSGMLAYVVPETKGHKHYASTSYSMKLLHGVHLESAVRGYQLALCTFDQSRSKDFSFSGYIVQGDTGLVQSCARLGKPVVSLIAELPGVPAVGTDDAAGFKTITRYLLRQGHRRIAIIFRNDEGHSSSLMRLQGYREAILEAGIQTESKWERRLSQSGIGCAVDYGYSEMQQWLRDGWADLHCTAVVTQNDGTAIGVIKALRQYGYRVPQDVSVTGYDDSGEDANFDLKLTTVHVPLEDIAQKAVRLLDQLVTGAAKSTKNIHLPTHLVTGESTAKV